MIRMVATIILTVSLASLAFAGPQTVVKDGSKVYIKGVDRLQWNKGLDCTFMGALTALARYLGDDVTYDYLMGVSGMAFRVQKWEQGWCPSAACVGPGYETHAKAFDALGYQMGFRGWYGDKTDTDKIAAMREPIMKSIDQGYPILFEDMDNGLIVGYSDDGNKLLCRSYFDKDDQYTQAAHWPWSIFFLEKKDKPIERKTAVNDSLRIALEEADTEKFNGYYSGWAAYDNWIAALRDEAKFTDKKHTEGSAQPNRFMYAVLADGRAAAARFLRSVQNDLGDESKPHILKAAALYQQIAKKLDVGRKHLPGEGKTWTKEMRKSQATVLMEVSKLEKQAIGELKAALASAG